MASRTGRSTRAGRGVRTRHALWPARLPAGRVNYGPIDPTTARTLFIRGALSTASSKRARPSWPTPEADREIRELEHKARRPTCWSTSTRSTRSTISACPPRDERCRIRALARASRAIRSASAVPVARRVMRHQAAGVTRPCIRKGHDGRTGNVAVVPLRTRQRSRRCQLTVPLYALNQVDAVDANGWCLAC